MELENKLKSNNLINIENFGQYSSRQLQKSDLEGYGKNGRVETVKGKTEAEMNREAQN